MKAWVLHDINDIRFEDVTQPVPAKNEVLVKVKAVGICGSDIPRIYRDGAHKMPLILGHEFAGQVVGLGNENNNVWLGKRVGVFPLIPCNQCVACKMNRHEMCRNYSYLGSRRNGAFAEYVAVPTANLIDLPNEVTWEQAAMLEPMAVAVHAIRRIEVKQDDIVVVCGLGTIGLLLTMFLLARGIKKVLVIGNKDLQKESALLLGVPEDYFCDMRKEDVVEWISKYTEAGADVFFECVGKNETVEQALCLTTPGGKICMVGNPYLDITLSKQVYWKILRNQLKIIGTWNSSFFYGNEDGSKTDWEYVVELLKSKMIKPELFISHKYDMEHLENGMRIMRDKSEDYMKVIGKICD